MAVPTSERPHVPTVHHPEVPIPLANLGPLAAPDQFTAPYYTLPLTPMSRQTMWDITGTRTHACRAATVLEDRADIGYSWTEGCRQSVSSERPIESHISD